MSSCVSISSNGTLRIDDSVSYLDCETFLLLTKDEFIQFNNTNLIDSLNSLFAFDPVIFSIVAGTSSVIFVSSHGAGHVLRWLGRG